MGGGVSGGEASRIEVNIGESFIFLTCMWWDLPADITVLRFSRNLKVVVLMVVLSRSTQWEQEASSCRW